MLRLMLGIVIAVVSMSVSLAAELPKPRDQRIIVRVEPVDLGRRMRDERPAEVTLDHGGQSFDATSLRIVRCEESGQRLDDDPLPFRWYDAAIPYDFPEFLDSVSRTAGELKPEPRERGGFYLNAIGEGRKGRLVWTHTQVGHQPSWYAVEFDWLKPNEVPQQLPPQGWIGDGQARCAETATQAVHSDHLRIDLDDWNGDAAIDLIVGDDFGHVVWWPNLGTKEMPRFEYTRLILDGDGVPIDVGTLAAPKVCDWDGDGDRDLLIGTYRNKLVWYENVGSDRERRLTYRGFVMLDGQPFELPVTPLTRGEPEIFNLDYYPVLEFVDWDGDGDNDLLAGGYITGCVFLYENVGSEKGSPPKLVARGPLEAEGQPLNVGHWCAAPCVVDLDGDGDLDLLSGHTPMREPGMKASIRLFENIGTRTAPKLTSGDLKAEHLWSITLGSPRAFDWDDDGDLDLVISVRTHILLLENAGSKTSPKFDRPPISILPKWGPAPVHADQLLDWNGDGRVDLVSSNTVRLHDGTKNPWSWSKSINVLPPGKTIEHRSGRGDEEHSTFLDDFDGDGAIDVLFGDWFGHVWLHRNRGSAEQPDFDLTGLKLTTRDGSPIKVGPIGLDPDKDFNGLQGARTVVTAGDFDGDQRRDLIVGDTFGKVRFFRQLPVEQRLAKETPLFEPAVEIGDLGIRLNVCATDWNQDGRLDVIAGSANGKVQVFLSMTAAGATSPFEAGFTPKLPSIMQPRVLLGDLNGDGDDDLYFPSTQGACFVERSFLNHGYAQGTIVATETATTASRADLRIGKLRVGKVLFLGNSITRHGPAPQIGWTGNWGMAASAQDKDFVHRLTSQITKAAGSKPEVKVKNIADFERRLTDYKLADELKEELAFEADVIIVALGENAASPKTDEAKAQFETAFTNLFTELKQHGQPTIFVRSQFWQDTEKDRLMKKTCDAAGGMFVDISKLGLDESNYARSERKIEHAGVAGHPGDKGMQALADALWKAIQMRSKPHD